MAEPVVARQRGYVGPWGSLLGAFGDLTSSEISRAFRLYWPHQGVVNLTFLASSFQCQCQPNILANLIITNITNTRRRFGNPTSRSPVIAEIVSIQSGTPTSRSPVIAEAVSIRFGNPTLRSPIIAEVVSI